MPSVDTSFEWEPDPDTGLSGDRSLLAEMDDHVDDISEAHEPGIYVLELSTPTTTDYEKVVRLWMREHDAVPDYLPSIAQSKRLLYVGAAKDVYERLGEHLSNPNRSTTVAAVFPIHSIRYIRWCESVEEAMQRESAVATDLQTNAVDAHIHSR